MSQQTPPDANHVLICPKIKYRFTRHNSCNEVLKDAFRLASIPYSLKPISLLWKDGRLPDGTTLKPWSNDKPIDWDFTCVHRLARSYHRVAAFPSN